MYVSQKQALVLPNKLFKILHQIRMESSSLSVFNLSRTTHRLVTEDTPNASVSLLLKLTVAVWGWIMLSTYSA